MGALLTQDEVLKRARAVHGDRWLYDKFVYKHMLTKSLIGCIEHGYFEQTPAKHVHQRQGCPKCGDIEREKNKRERILKDRFEGVVQPVDYKIIPINGGEFTQVSNEDFSFASKVVWTKGGNGYVSNKAVGYLHKSILPVKRGNFVDHIDRNPLNNRRENLREVTPQESVFNTKPYGASQYKGVSWDKKWGQWLVQIVVGGRNVCRKNFDEEIAAAKYYDQEIVKYHGDKAYLNFPDSK